VIGHAGMICGNNAFRKHHVGELSFWICYFANPSVPLLNLTSLVFLRIFAFVSLRCRVSVHPVDWL
jgi:hypothetical protein